jgi:hypothetical protein
MYALRNKFLSRSCFSCDEHIAGGSCQLCNVAPDLLDKDTVTDHLLLGTVRSLRARLPATWREALQNSSNARTNLIEIERSFEVIVDAGPDSFDGETF